MANTIDITINNLLPEWKQIIKELPYQIDIEIEIVDRLEFNASAIYTKDERYIIQINSGVFKRIYDFYHSTFNKTNPDFVRMATYPIVENWVYEEKEAINLADLYVYLSLKFIFLHELGHVLNGHLAYMSSLIKGQSYFKLSMNEEEDNQVNGISSSSYQMLEIDADSFAATNLLNALLSCYHIDMTYIDRYKSLIPTLHHLVLFSITSNIVSMSLQGLSAHREVNELSHERYIPKRTRLYEIIRVYIRLYNLHYGHQTTIEEVHKLVKPFESLVDQYLITTAYYDESILSAENNSWELDDSIHSYVHSLYIAEWPLLRSKLKKFSFAELAL